MRSRNLSFRLVAVGAAALTWVAGCAHSLVVTSDPPGLPAALNGRPLGVTPLVVDEEEPYAVHALTVGEGPGAVTQVVLANRLLAREEASIFLLPLGCLCFVPLYWTAGTDDRVHVALELSGRRLGDVPESKVELEYLPPDARYPHGVFIERQVVAGKPVRVMVSRRRFITTFNYQGLSLPRETMRMYPQDAPNTIRPPLLSFGVEQEWLAGYRFGIGGGVSYRAFEGGVLGSRIVPRNTEDTENTPLVGLREWRAGFLARYRHPLLRWDGMAGGLDAVLGLGLDAARQQFIDRRFDDHVQMAYLPWGEAGLDFGFTRAVGVFAADRYYPTAAPEPGGVWGNLGAVAEHRVTLGARLYW